MLQADSSSRDRMKGGGGRRCLQRYLQCLKLIDSLRKLAADVQYDIFEDVVGPSQKTRDYYGKESYPTIGYLNKWCAPVQ